VRILLRLVSCPSPTPMRGPTQNIGRLGFGSFVQVDSLRLVPNLGWNPKDDTQIRRQCSQEITSTYGKFPDGDVGITMRQSGLRWRAMLNAVAVTMVAGAVPSGQTVQQSLINFDGVASVALRS
jgi:hypothetical protein